MFFFAVLGSVNALAQAQSIEIDHAVLTLDASAGDEGASQLNVSFPDYWVTARRQIASQGVYRMAVTVPASVDAAEPWVVYLVNLSGHVNLFWDGRFLGRSTSFTGVGVPMVSGPVMVTIPADRLRGEHQLALEFTSSVSNLSYLRAPVIAPLAEVAPQFARKRLTLIYLPVVLGVVSIIVALVFYAAYRTDPSGRGVGWMTVGLIAASLSMLGLYLPPGDEWAGLLARTRPAVFHLSFVFFLLAIREMGESGHRFAMYLVLMVSLLFLIAIAAVPEVQIFRVAALWMPFTYAIGLYLLIQVWRFAVQTPGRLATLVPIALVPVFIVHDWIGLAKGGDFWADQMLGIYNSALFAFSLMLLLIARARQHMEELLVLNQELESRVAEKHQQLETHYAQMAAVERREAALYERERMVRDMHDGLGGQLTSTLALVESGKFSPQEVENALRDVLDDLRMMVHSIDSPESTLLDLLAMVRERVEPRMNRQGVAFRWRVDGAGCERALSPESAGHVLRIVQEALTNVIKHADASEITISTEQQGSSRIVCIDDNGKGLVNETRGAATVAGGRGLRHMRKRAEALGGAVTVRPLPDGGTRVELQLPKAGL